MLLSIVAAVAIFATLVVVHEAGHFLIAKRLGVRVLRFSIGYPPRIFGIRRGETDYALGATPLGGYVRMLGDEISEEPGQDAIKSYLGEIALDLIEAANSTGWLKQSVQKRPIFWSNGQNQQDQALRTLADAIVSSQPVCSDGLLSESETETALTPSGILARPPSPVEQILLQQIRDCGSVSRAIEVL